MRHKDHFKSEDFKGLAASLSFGDIFFIPISSPIPGCGLLLNLAGISVASPLPQGVEHTSLLTMFCDI